MVGRMYGRKTVEVTVHSEEHVLLHSVADDTDTDSPGAGLGDAETLAVKGTGIQTWKEI